MLFYAQSDFYSAAPRFEYPIRSSSTSLAAFLPSRIAQTTRNWPRHKYADHRRILRFRQRLNDIFHNDPRHILSRRRQPSIRQKLKLLFLQAVSRKKQPTRFFRILKRLAAHSISKFFNYIHCSFFHSFKFIFLSYRPDADGYGSAPLQANGYSLL